MKCKLCGYNGRTINSMRKHYLKDHPDAMKRKKRNAAFKGVSKGLDGNIKYCKYCGKRIE